MTHNEHNQHDAFDRTEISDGETTMNEQEKLTAYALGELDGDDAQQIAQLIERDSSARAEVEAVQAMAGDLTTALAGEPAAELTEEQRTRIEAGPKNGSGVFSADDAAPAVVYTFPAARWAGIGLLAAAALGLAFVWPMMTHSGDNTVAIEAPAGTETTLGLASADDAVLGERFKATDRRAGAERLNELEGVKRRAGDVDDLTEELARASEMHRLLDATADTHVLSNNGNTDVNDPFVGLNMAGQSAAETSTTAPLNEPQVLASSPGNTNEIRWPAARQAQPAPLEAGKRRRPIPKTPRAMPGTEGGDFSGGGQSAGGGSGGSLFADPADGPQRGHLEQQTRGQTPADSELVELMRRASQHDLSEDERQRLNDALKAYSVADPKAEEARNNIEAAEQLFSFRGEAPDFGKALGSDARHFREAYARLTDNPFERTVSNPAGENNLSTFSIDVDTASYANVRRYLNSGQLPPAGAVRIEELINYFDYGYETPGDGVAHPFNVDVQVTSAPWQPEHRLVRIGLKGYEVPMEQRPATNLVFLLDTSGSMNQPNKLPLVKQSINMLVDALHGDDRVAIVTYAGSSGLALDSTYVDDKAQIKSAVNALSPGGSTHGSAGIELAYDVAQEYFIDGGINRVVLCTDGDFNVGVTSDSELVSMIEEKRETGVFLSVLGFGTGNWQDEKMEQLSNHGNGVAAYIDGVQEAKKVMVEQAAGTLLTIAKDVKLQVDFNHQKVAAYRLIGYANRMLEAQDFADDTKDAGEIGAGHTVTALYEVVPVGVEVDIPAVDSSKYAVVDARKDASVDGEDARMREPAARKRAADRETASGGEATEEGNGDDSDAKLGTPLKTVEDKEAAINSMLLQVRELQKEMKYDDALAVIDQMLFIDEHNSAALMLRDAITQTIAIQQGGELSEEWRLPDMDSETVISGRRVEEFAPVTDELLTVRLRYKQPDADTSVRFDVPVVDTGTGIDAADADVQFAAAVASFGMLLRNSPYKGRASWAQVLDLAEAGRGADRHGYRAEFIELVRKAQQIAETRKVDESRR